MSDIGGYLRRHRGAGGTVVFVRQPSPCLATCLQIAQVETASRLAGKHTQNSVTSVTPLFS